MLLLLLLLFACPSAAPSDDDDSAAAETCADLLADGATWAVDPDGEDGQIHPDSILIGDALWTAYNRPDGTSNFGVFVVARGCDGGEVLAPTRLDDGSGNSTDPTIAVNGDSVLVAWQTDAGGLTVRTALLSTSGEVLWDDTPVAFSGVDVPADGNVWMPRLTATSSGFALAVSHAHEGTGQFEAGVLRLDGDGQPDGDLLFLDPGDAGLEPAITADGDALFVAWETTLDGSGGGGFAEVSAAGAVTVNDWSLMKGPGRQVVLSRDSAGWVWGGRGRGGPFLGVARTGADASRVQPEDSPPFGSAPGLAPLAEGAVIAWHEGTATDSAVRIRAWDGATGFPSWRSDPVLVHPGPTGAYPADITALGLDHVAITYAVGPTPGFRLETAVVALP